jgi:hypothetical protein
MAFMDVVEERLGMDKEIILEKINIMLYFLGRRYLLLFVQTILIVCCHYNI